MKAAREAEELAAKKAAEAAEELAAKKLAEELAAQQKKEKETAAASTKKGRNAKKPASVQKKYVAPAEKQKPAVPVVVPAEKTPVSYYFWRSANLCMLFLAIMTRYFNLLFFRLLRLYRTLLVILTSQPPLVVGLNNVPMLRRLKPRPRRKLN